MQNAVIFSEEFENVIGYILLAVFALVYAALYFQARRRAPDFRLWKRVLEAFAETMNEANENKL